MYNDELDNWNNAFEQSDYHLRSCWSDNEKYEISYKQQAYQLSMAQCLMNLERLSEAKNKAADLINNMYNNDIKKEAQVIIDSISKELNEDKNSEKSANTVYV